jgi:hypothetical protein
MLELDVVEGLHELVGFGFVLVDLDLLVAWTRYCFWRGLVVGQAWANCV